MKRNAVLKVLNPILGILALNQILTGLLSGALSSKAFEILHEGGGIIFAATALIHLALNWAWVKSNFKRNSSVPKPPMAGK